MIGIIESVIIGIIAWACVSGGYLMGYFDRKEEEMR